MLKKNNVISNSPCIWFSCTLKYDYHYNKRVYLRQGSTSAMCESILRRHGLRTGFYSSPHLVAVRERIRLGGRVLGEDEFAKYFHEVYDKLEATQVNLLLVSAHGPASRRHSRESWRCTGLPMDSCLTRHPQPSFWSKQKWFFPIRV